MASTVTVTGRIADLSSVNQPDWKPRVLISASEASVTRDGTVVTTEPTVMTMDESGNLTAQVIPASEFDRPVTYQLTIDWVSPSGRTALRERLSDFTVTPGGGNLGGLATVPLNNGMIWESATAPDPSVLAQYQLNSTTGDLVERTA